MHSRAWVGGGAVLIAVLTGCAGVPASGPVHIAGAPPAVSGVDGPNVRRFPSGPAVGMTQKELVGGFLNALVDSDSNYSIARQFLAPGTPWSSTANITLYDQNSAVINPHHSRMVDVRMQRVGIIDRHAGFRAEPGTLDVRFRLLRHDGQWRISRLPSGVLLSTSDAQRSLQPLDVYYLNHAQTQLVPEPVLVPPGQPGLATTLIAKLLSGPSRALAPAVVTRVPAGTSLAGSVPIDANGVAEVNLSGTVQPLASSQLERLSAQIVWTLRQVSGVTQVQLLNNGAPLSTTDVPSLQSIGAWPEFDPEAPPSSTGALLSRQGRIVGLGRTVPIALRRRDLLSPAVSDDGTTVAALRRMGGVTTLLVGPADGTLRSRLTGSQLSAPAFDPQGDVVVVKGSGRRSVVIEVPAHGSAREVDVSPEIRVKGILALAVSRDGSRVAMVVGPPGQSELVVGTVSVARRALVINGGVAVIAPALDALGVAWAGGGDIVTTVRENASRRAVVESSVDGYSVHVLPSAGLVGAPTEVADSPGQPVLAGTGGEVWSLADRRWKRVATGSGPSYAG